jgi:hypothetical protein
MRNREFFLCGLIPEYSAALKPSIHSTHNHFMICRLPANYIGWNMMLHLFTPGWFFEYQDQSSSRKHKPIARCTQRNYWALFAAASKQCMAELLREHEGAAIIGMRACTSRWHAIKMAVSNKLEVTWNKDTAWLNGRVAIVLRQNLITFILTQSLNRGRCGSLT